MKKYIVIKLYVPEEHQDTFIAIISDLEFTGIEQVNDELTINFLANNYNENVENELSDSANKLGFEYKLISQSTIEEKNWNEDWEKSLEPVVVNHRLVICPTSKVNSLANDYEYIIKINPQMSFGTGYHATTRLASALLLDSVAKGEDWVDAGTGTGVLAILASKIGAKSVFAFDIDEWSVNNTIENIELNSVKNVTVDQSDLNTLQFSLYDGIVANIFANILIENMKKFSEAIKTDGVFICTGILKYDKERVLDAAIDNGFELFEELNEDEWVAYKFRKKL
ncbi:MAG: 50S ribosomal protein L11 methyltransferase [Candidatus Kapaibacterium sp.]